MKKTKTRTKKEKQDIAAEEPADEKTETPPESADAEAVAPAPDESLEQRLVRLQADFANYKKRVVRERTELYRRANEDLIADLLTVIDHYEMGLAEAERHDVHASVMDGFRLVYSQLMSTLRKYGLEEIEAEGRAFDPHVHECISHLPSAEHPPDTVIAQTRKGYRIGDQVVRASQVVVSSGPAEAPEDEPQNKPRDE